MHKKSFGWFSFLIALLMSLAPLRSFGEAGAGLEQPVYYEADAMRQALTLITEGYGLLEQRNFSGADGAFKEAARIVPCKWIPLMGSALAYAYKGEADGVLEALDRLARSGWDNPDELSSVPAFGFVQDDPRFQAAMERFRDNYDKNTSALASGLPRWNEAPDVQNEDQLKAWIGEQDRNFNLNKKFWSSSEYLIAKIDLRTRILEAQKRLAGTNPDFDYGLERIRLAYGLEARDKMGWGAVADMVRREADAYAASVGDENRRQEAFYIAGSAVSRKYADNDPRRTKAYREAAQYLERVATENANYAAAQALLIANKIKSSDSAEDSALIARLREIAVKHDGDQALYGEISSRLRFDIDRYLWPISIDRPDVDGEAVTLKQYAGKVLLIDFWAIWCGPCRAALPAMREAFERFHNKGFEILSVSLDSTDRIPMEEFRKWIGENGMEWRHIYDGMGWKSELVKRYFVARVPKALLVGPDGSLLAWGDDLHRDKLVETVELAMAGLKR